MCPNSRPPWGERSLELVPQESWEISRWSSSGNFSYGQGSFGFGWKAVGISGPLDQSCYVDSYSQLPMQPCCSVTARPLFKDVEEMQAAKDQRWFWSPGRLRAESGFPARPHLTGDEPSPLLLCGMGLRERAVPCVSLAFLHLI